MGDMIKVCTEISIYNTPLYALEEVLYRLEERIRHYDYGLNKYTWDGKKPYSPSQADHVKELRYQKASVLLSIRKTQKLIKVVDT